MADLTVAASEKAFKQLFKAVRDEFAFQRSGNGVYGPLSASYSVVAHLEGGTVDLRDDNTVRIGELDVVWDVLALNLGYNISEQCIGGWCIIPSPWGCAVRAPKKCFFSGNPDILIPINLGGLLRSEVSFTGGLTTSYFVDSDRKWWMNDLDAQEKKVPNMWQVFLRAESIDLDAFDVPDIVGDLIDKAVDAAIDTALGPLPGWAKDFLKSLLDPIINLIRAALDIPDDVDEWFSDLLGTSLGVVDFLLTAIVNWYASENPIHEFEDPFQILEPSNGLIPVKIPVRNLAVRVTGDEMILEANVGP